MERNTRSFSDFDLNAMNRAKPEISALKIGSETWTAADTPTMG
jgi:hypothetical protein